MKTITVQSQHQMLEIEFVLEWNDIAQAEAILLGQLRRKQGRHVHFRLAAVIPTLLALSGIVVAVLFATREPANVIVFSLLISALLSLVIGYWWVMRTERIAMDRLRNRGPGKQQWIAKKNGFTCVHGGTRMQLPWTSILRVQRLGTSLALFVDEMHYYLIPDRAFVTEKQNLRLMRLLKDNVSGRRA